MDSWHLRDEVQEAGQRLIGMVSHMAELHHHFLLQLVIDDGDRERGSLVGQKVPIVCALEMKLQVWKRSAEAS